MNEGRAVYIPYENVMGEIVSEQVHGAYVKYQLGGFERTEFMTADDYELLNYFEFEEGDQ